MATHDLTIDMSKTTCAHCGQTPAIFRTKGEKYSHYARCSSDSCNHIRQTAPHVPEQYMDATSFSIRHIAAEIYITVMSRGLGETGRRQVVLAMLSVFRIWRAAELLGYNDYSDLALRLTLRDVAYAPDDTVLQQLQEYLSIWGNDLTSVLALEHAINPTLFTINGLPPRGAYTALTDPEPIRSDLPSQQIECRGGAWYAVSQGNVRPDDSRSIREIVTTAQDIFLQQQDPSAVALALLDAQLTPLPVSAQPGNTGPGWPLEQDLFLLQAVSNGSSMWECTRRMNAKGVAGQIQRWAPRSIEVVNRRVDLWLWGTALIAEWRRISVTRRFTT